MAKPHSPKPTISELRRGFESAIKNAIRYYQDAQLLFKDDRVESATLLSIYSLDEFGKAMMIAKVIIHPDQSETAWINHIKNVKDHKPKIKVVLELFWMFQAAFLLGQDRFCQLIEEESTNVMALRAGIAFVDLKDGVFSVPLKAERDRCLSLLSLLDQWFSYLDRILPRLRTMMDGKVVT